MSLQAQVFIIIMVVGFVLGGIAALTDKGIGSKLWCPSLPSSKSGSKPNAIGAEHNEAIGRRMTHSQGSNSVAKHSALIVSHI